VVGTSVVRNDHSTRDFAEKTQPPANHYGNIPLYRLETSRSFAAAAARSAQLCR